MKLIYYWWDDVDPETRFERSDDDEVGGDGPGFCYRCDRFSGNTILLTNKARHTFPVWVAVCEEYCYQLLQEDGTLPELSSEEKAWMYLR